MSDVIDDAIVAVAVAAGDRGATLEQVRGAAGAADPDLATSVDQRARLRRSLDRLAAEGRLRLPAARAGWDRTGSPELPLRVRPPARAQVPKPPAVQLPDALRPELESARTLLRPRADEVAVLEVVNSYLRDRPAEPVVVPARVRSFELFGDEKRLDRLVGARLFSLGVVSLALLDCYPTSPPFVWQQVGDGADILVVENHHTYALLADSLAVRARPPIGRLGYGAGKAFVRSAVHVREMVPPPAQLWYFGDLDAAGLEVPIAAEAASGLSIRPAVGLYEAALAAPSSPGAAVAESYAATLASWLPDHLAGAAVALLSSGCRVPQEAVGRPEADDLAGWLAP